MRNLTTFDGIIDHVMGYEGGYVDNSSDRGGATKHGITIGTLRMLEYDLDTDGDVDKKDVQLLSDGLAKKIMKEEYWDKGRVESVPKHLRFIYFDMCINHGISGAVKVLQKSSNSKNKTQIKVDGGLGPITRKAIKNVELDRICAYRIMKYASIVFNDKKQNHFYYGWFKQTIDLMERA